MLQTVQLRVKQARGQAEKHYKKAINSYLVNSGDFLQIHNKISCSWSITIGKYFKCILSMLHYSSPMVLLVHAYYTNIYSCFAGAKLKSPQVTLKYISECKAVLEFYLNSSDEANNSLPGNDHVASLPEDKDLPKNLLKLLTCKLRQHLKELVAVHMKKR